MAGQLFGENAFHRGQRFVAERRAEHGAGLFGRHTARAQVEQRIGVELAHGGAVRRLDLVGVDHQRWLAIDLGIGRQQQVLVGQVGISAVGTFADADPAMEHHAAAVGRHATPDQLGAGVLGDVLDAQAGIDMATASAQQHAIGGQLGVVAFQAHVELMAAQCCTQFQVDTAVFGIAGQHRVGAQQRSGARAVGLYAGMRQHRVLGDVDVDEGVVQVRAVASLQVVLDQAEHGATAQLDKVTVMPGVVAGIRRADKHQMQRGFADDAVGDLHQHAFIGECGIELGEHFFGALEATAKEAQRLGLFGLHGRQGAHLHTGIQRRQIAQRSAVATVDEDQTRRRDVSQQRGIDVRGLQRRGCEAAALQLAQRGVLPGLVACGGQAGLERSLKNRLPFGDFR